MNDFEERLARALKGAADRAPEPAPELSSGAKGHHGHRVALLAAAAAVLAVAIPAGVVALVQRDSTTTPPVSTQSPTPTSQTPTPPPVVPAGWRVETWHSVTLLVPDTWGYGDIHGCWFGDSPKVERPGGEHLGCLRQGWGYGVAFFPPDTAKSPESAFRVDPVHPDAAVGLVDVNGASVIIVAPDEWTRDRITASVRDYEGIDPNGCPATIALPDPQAAPYAAANGDPAVLCAYEMPPRGIGTAFLAASDRLDPDEASKFAQALEAAPLGGGPPSRLDSCWANEVSVAIAYNDARTWIYVGCRSLGVGEGDEARRLTSDLLYWALIPGWNSFVDPAVPMPSELRKH